MSTFMPDQSHVQASIQKRMQKQQRWFRASLLITGVFVLACFVLLDPILRGYKRKNFQDAKPQVGIATVVMLVNPTGNFVGATKHEDNGFVDVRFQGGMYKVNEVKSFVGLHVDAPAQIHYRVGRNGAVAVDSVEPLPEPEQRQQAAGSRQ